MWKTVLAGTAALAIAASTVALAQPSGNRDEGLRRRPPTTEDIQAYSDAWLAALKAGLSLTDQQAANWQPFEQAVRDLQKLRMERRKARTEQRNNPAAQAADPAERLGRRATAMSETGAALKKVADAMDPLYKSLNDNQKRRFIALSRYGVLRNFIAERRGFRDRFERGSRGDRFGHDFRNERGFREGWRSYGYEPRDYGRGYRPDESDDYRR